MNLQAFGDFLIGLFLSVKNYIDNKVTALTSEITAVSSLVQAIQINGASAAQVVNIRKGVGDMENDIREPSIEGTQLIRFNALVDGDKATMDLANMALLPDLDLKRTQADSYLDGTVLNVSNGDTLLLTWVEYEDRLVIGDVQFQDDVTDKLVRNSVNDVFADIETDSSTNKVGSNAQIKAYLEAHFAKEDDFSALKTQVETAFNAQGWD